MNFKILEDLKYYKLITLSNDDEIAEKMRISRMTLSRWEKDGNLSPNDLEVFYTFLFDEGVFLNKLKEELYQSMNDSRNSILFHGAKNEIIGKPSVLYSGQNKDFGKGFYLGTSFEQASSFVSLYKDSSVYIFKLKNVNTLKIKEFDVSSDWMLLIAYFRGMLEKYKNTKTMKNLLKKIDGVDVVIAPIADNTMYEILNEFAQGEITNLQCFHALSANRLGKQYVIINDKTIDENLEIMDRCYVSQKERNSYSKARREQYIVGKDKVILAKRKYAGMGKYVEELFHD